MVGYSWNILLVSIWWFSTFFPHTSRGHDFKGPPSRQRHQNLGRVAVMSNSEKLLGDSQLPSSSESLPYTETSFQHHSGPSITQLCLGVHRTTCGPAQDSFPPSTLVLPNLLCCLFPHFLYTSYPFRRVKTH